MLTVTVAQRQAVAEDIVALTLVDPQGRVLPPYSPGAHIDVEIGGGLTRQYSLYGDPEQSDRYNIAVLWDRAGRGGSAHVHNQLKEGDTLHISPPRNLFSLVPAHKSILFAGGIGITPLLSMARVLSRTRADFSLHYCARTSKRAAFADWLERSPFAGQVQFHFDDGAPDQRFDAAKALPPPTPHEHLYVCGPQGFMDHVIATARQLGWAETNIHFEYFSAAPAIGGKGFELRLARRGLSVFVEPDQTVVAALNTLGIEVPVSCEQGVCGTCVLPIIEGKPDHRDVFFTDAERLLNDRFTPCCSRSNSPVLVIDL